MLLAVVGTGLTFWATIIVCGIVALLLFVKVIKFWLKALLVIGLIILVGKCYFTVKLPRTGGTLIIVQPIRFTQHLPENYFAVTCCF